MFGVEVRDRGALAAVHCRRATRVQIHNYVIDVGIVHNGVQRIACSRVAEEPLVIDYVV